jgi:hypothetical protein
MKKYDHDIHVPILKRQSIMCSLLLHAFLKS